MTALNAGRVLARWTARPRPDAGAVCDECATALLTRGRAASSRDERLARIEELLVTRADPSPLAEPSGD
jgi:hypothetical protein